jgi:hypothetical protein
MTLKPYIPTIPQVSREALTVIAGAIVAAFIIGQMPGARTWIRNQWTGS